MEQSTREKELAKKKRYYYKHREELLEKKRVYNRENKEKVSAQRAEKITCSCGSIVRKAHIRRHEKSSKHQGLKTKKSKEDNKKTRRIRQVKELIGVFTAQGDTEKLNHYQVELETLLN